MKTKAQKALDQYFHMCMELRKQCKAGMVDSLHGMIKEKHYLKVLAEESYRAFLALDISKGQIYAARFMDSKEFKAAGHLNNYDSEAYKAWHDQWEIQNLEMTASKILDAIESIVIPPIPEPDPERVKKLDAAYKYQILSGTAGRATQSTTGHSFVTVVGTGGGGGGGGSGGMSGSTGTSVGTGGASASARDHESPTD